MIKPKPKLFLKSDSKKYTQKPHFVAILYYTKIVLELYQRWNVCTLLQGL